MSKEIEMAGMDREGGAFFANSRKQKDSHPDYRGELRVTREVVDALVQQLQGGVQHPVLELSGWKKTSNSGTVYISLQGKKPYKMEMPTPQNAPKDWGGGGGGNAGWTPPKGMPDDEIPFAPEVR